MARAAKTVAVAGAKGFVGRALCSRLVGRQDLRVVGLSRRSTDDELHEWRVCDLYSLLELEQALEGVDLAIYLVHSMMPTSRLTQAKFEDLDLILADNFGRAAQRAGVQRIIYLGGLVPRTGRLSPHLASRVEVERALGAHGVPVTTLRAGLVIGPNGSSLEILLRLVERLPAMMLPAWTATQTQPIALADVVGLIEYCIEDPATAGRTCDIGGPDVLTYREMIEMTARMIGRPRPTVGVPLLTPRLSRLWVRLVTGVSGELVGPLVESLRHPMVCRDRWLQDRAKRPGQRWTDALEQSLAGRRASASGSARPVKTNTVRSVQRLPLPAGKDAHWVADEYMRWLPRFVRPFLAVELDGPDIRMLTRPVGACLLHLRYSVERSRADRALFYIVGGSLADQAQVRGRLEFRLTPDGAGVLAAIHDFVPALPWWVYNATQAQLHAFVMRGFADHLMRCRELPAVNREALLPPAPGN